MSHLGGLVISASLFMGASCSSVGDPTQSADALDSPENIEVGPTSAQDETSALLSDLVLDFFWDITYTSDCPWGGPGYLIVRGRNAGGRDASEFAIQVWDQTEIIDALPSGEQVQVRFDFESGPVSNIPAVIDSEDQVFESDEENNELLIIFTPPPRCTPTGG
jgi:hypothetical protein